MEFSLAVDEVAFRKLLHGCHAPWCALQNIYRYHRQRAVYIAHRPPAAFLRRAQTLPWYHVPWAAHMLERRARTHNACNSATLRFLAFDFAPASPHVHSTLPGVVFARTLKCWVAVFACWFWSAGSGSFQNTRCLSALIPQVLQYINIESSRSRCREHRSSSFASPSRER